MQTILTTFNLFKRNVRLFILWEKRHHIIPHLIVFCLCSFLLAKAFFHDHAGSPFLFLYGLSVTIVVLLQFSVAFFLYKDPYSQALALAKKSPKRKKGARVVVSCVVAVFNEEKIIRDCVASICAQTYANKEIIFVNDCSTDSTGGILDQLAREFPITVIHLSQNVGKKAALARAIAVSKGKIIAFTDSDSLWQHDAIEKIVTIFQHLPDVGAVSGHTRALNAGTNFITKVQDAWYEGQYSVRKAFESHFGAVTCVSGPLAVFRREAIYNYIPAWENDSFFGQEFRFATDRTLTGFVLGAASVGKKLKHQYRHSKFATPNYPVKEYRVVYSKAARALTEVPDSLPRVLKQQVRWKKSFIRNTFFTGAFYWRNHPLAALTYYLHILFVVAGPLIVLRHLVYLPLTGNPQSVLLYLSGIIFIGYMFGLAYKLENPSSRRWVYRPFMSFFSTLVLSWLIFYSLITIRRMRWHRG